jgi:predicted DNA-binding protein (MmcQ/YjbR family)
MLYPDSRFVGDTLHARQIARIPNGHLTTLGAAVMLSGRRATSALRYLALMSRSKPLRAAAQAHR